MNNRGIGLIELLLSMAIGSVVAMAAYTVFVSSNWSARTQESVAEAQQNVRVAMDRLSRDIRTAGFGLPDPPFTLTIGGIPFTSPVTVGNSSSGPDTITLLGIGYHAGLLKRGGAADCNAPTSTKLCLENAAAIDNFKKSDGTFNPKRVYVSLGGMEFVQLLDTNQDEMGSLKLKTSGSISGNYVDADKIPVYIIQAVEYSVATDLPNQGCTSATPCLVSRDFTDLRDSGRWAVAGGIEDIQFAYGLDFNPRDGRVDEMTDGAAGYSQADFVSSPGDPGSIIAVRASVVAKARTPDPKGDKRFGRPVLEDRAAGTADDFQRRTLTSIIKLRNPRTGT